MRPSPAQLLHESAVVRARHRRGEGTFVFLLILRFARFAPRRGKVLGGKYARLTRPVHERRPLLTVQPRVFPHLPERVSCPWAFPEKAPVRAWPESWEARFPDHIEYGICATSSNTTSHRFRPRSESGFSAPYRRMRAPFLKSTRSFPLVHLRSGGPAQFS